MATFPGSKLIKHFGSLLGAGGVDRTLHDKLAERISPEDFGAIGDGVTDDTAALTRLSAMSGVIDGGDKVYLTGQITFSNAVTLRLRLKAAPAFSGTTGLIVIAGNHSNIDLIVDANGKGITCVDVQANGVTGRVEGNNITGVPQAQGGSQSACRITGQYCDLLVYANNHQKGTSDNDSIPRVATVDLSGSGTGNNNTVRVYGANINAALVCSQAQVYAPEIQTDTTTDNVIYHLAGRLTAGRVTAKNALDETFVCEGTAVIDTLHIIDGAMSAGLQSGDAYIREYVIESTRSDRRYVPFRTRTGNVKSNLAIGTLRGEIYLTTPGNGAGIFQFAAGELTSLQVARVDMKVHYLSDSTKILASNDAGQQVRIGALKLELIDETAALTISDKFDFKLPTSLTLPSLLGAVDNVSSSGEIRVVNAFQSLMQISPEQEINVTAGPYVLQRNATTPCPRHFISTGVPSVAAGTWLRGDVISVKFPAAGGGVVEWSCTTGGVGVAATWRATKWITGKGTTANRPVLTANDVGVTYLDTTLNANGKSIMWTGTAWVDATGATV